MKALSVVWVDLWGLGRTADGGVVSEMRRCQGPLVSIGGSQNMTANIPPAHGITGHYLSDYFRKSAKLSAHTRRCAMCAGGSRNVALNVGVIK